MNPVEMLAKRLEQFMRGEVVDVRRADQRVETAVRDHQRECTLTLSDGEVWRYYNASNYWECCSGPLKDRFSEKPVRKDHAALTEADVDGIRRVKHFGVTGAKLSPSGDGGKDG